MQATRGQKDRAEKKLFFGTEFQEVSCYSLVNEKGTTNLLYANLHNINRTVVGPEVICKCMKLHTIFRRSSGQYWTATFQLWQSNLQGFADVSLCWPLVMANIIYSSHYFYARYITRDDAI